MASRVKRRPVTTWESLPPILDVPAVAMLLGITEQAVRYMAKRGDIPAFKVGLRLWRFEKTALMNAVGVQINGQD